MCTTRRVAAASRSRHKPSRAGGGADRRIPLRTGPALDRQRVLAGSGARHRRGGAARGFILGAPVSRRTSLAHMLSPEASSSKGGSAESNPIPSGGGSAASLGRSRAAGGEAAEGTRAGALWIRGCLSSQASVASHCVGAQVLQTSQGAILEHARCRGHCWCVSQLVMALQHVLHRTLILLLGERDVLRSVIKITRNVENM